MDEFVANMYPGNGTMTYQSSTADVENTHQELNTPILVALVLLALVFLTFACLFIACYYKEKEESRGGSREVLTGKNKIYEDTEETGAIN